MCLNGGPLGVCTPPPPGNPVLLHFTLHAILPATIILIRNGWFHEAVDILTLGNITIVFMARHFLVGKSSVWESHVSLGGELFVLDSEMTIGWAG